MHMTSFECGAWLDQDYKKLQVLVCFEGVIWNNIRKYTQIIQTDIILQIK